MITEFLAAGAEGDVKTEFGFWAAMEGNYIAWAILIVLIIMSVGSFYILITKYLELLHRGVGQPCLLGEVHLTERL